jgi:hypothetical protein
MKPEANFNPILTFRLEFERQAKSFSLTTPKSGVTK